MHAMVTLSPRSPNKLQGWAEEQGMNHIFLMHFASITATLSNDPSTDQIGLGWQRILTTFQARCLTLFGT